MATGANEKGAVAYGREALSHWGEAIRYGARAISARRQERADRAPLKDRLNPARTDKGGKAGDVADKALSKMGTPGKLASKVSLGSRIVERIGGQAIANRPLLLLAVLLVVLGVQLMGLGLVGEIIVHLRSPHRRAYRVRERV